MARSGNDARRSKAVAAITRRVVGETPWGATQGHGAFITMSFGRRIEHSPDSVGDPDGEWFLWIYSCTWVILRDRIPVAYSESNRRTIETGLRSLESRPLSAVEILDEGVTRFCFGNDVDLVCLPTLPTSDSEWQEWDSGRLWETWMLWTPERTVLAVGPRTRWELDPPHKMPQDDGRPD